MQTDFKKDLWKFSKWAEMILEKKVQIDTKTEHQSTLQYPNPWGALNKPVDSNVKRTRENKGGKFF